MELLRSQFRNGDPAQPLRHRTRDVLRQLGSGSPDADWIDDALIVISELVQNVTQHTDGGGELVVHLRPGAVLVEVGDASIDAPRARNPGPNRPGGRGLLLIEAISQQWGVRICRAGKVVWVELPAVAHPRCLSAA